VVDAIYRAQVDPNSAKKKRREIPSTTNAERAFLRHDIAHRKLTRANFAMQSWCRADDEEAPFPVSYTGRARPGMDMEQVRRIILDEEKELRAVQPRVAESTEKLTTGKLKRESEAQESRRRAVQSRMDKHEHQKNLLERYVAYRTAAREAAQREYEAKIQAGEKNAVLGRFVESFTEFSKRSGQNHTDGVLSPKNKKKTAARDKGISATGFRGKWKPPLLSACDTALGALVCSPVFEELAKFTLGILLGRLFGPWCFVAGAVCWAVLESAYRVAHGMPALVSLYVVCGHVVVTLAGSSAVNVPAALMMSMLYHAAWNAFAFVLRVPRLSARSKHSSMDMVVIEKCTALVDGHVCQRNGCDAICTGARCCAECGTEKCACNKYGALLACRLAEHGVVPPAGWYRVERNILVRRSVLRSIGLCTCANKACQACANPSTPGFCCASCQAGRSSDCICPGLAAYVCAYRTAHPQGELHPPSATAAAGGLIAAPENLAPSATQENTAANAAAAAAGGQQRDGAGDMAPCQPDRVSQWFSFELDTASDSAEQLVDCLGLVEEGSSSELNTAIVKAVAPSDVPSLQSGAIAEKEMRSVSASPTRTEPHVRVLGHFDAGHVLPEAVPVDEKEVFVPAESVDLQTREMFDRVKRSAQDRWTLPSPATQVKSLSWALVALLVLAVWFQLEEVQLMPHEELWNYLMPHDPYPRDYKVEMSVSRSVEEWSMSWCGHHPMSHFRSVDAECARLYQEPLSLPRAALCCTLVPWAFEKLPASLVLLTVPESCSGLMHPLVLLAVLLAVRAVFVFCRPTREFEFSEMFRLLDTLGSPSVNANTPAKMQGIYVRETRRKNTWFWRMLCSNPRTMFGLCPDPEVSLLCLTLLLEVVGTYDSTPEHLFSTVASKLSRLTVVAKSPGYDDATLRWAVVLSQAQGVRSRPN